MLRTGCRARADEMIGTRALAGLIPDATVNAMEVRPIIFSAGADV